MTAGKVTFFAVHSWISFVRTHGQKYITVQHCKEQMGKKKKNNHAFPHIRLLAVKWQQL